MEDVFEQIVKSFRAKVMRLRVIVQAKPQVLYRKGKCVFCVFGPALARFNCQRFLCFGLFVREALLGYGEGVGHILASCVVTPAISQYSRPTIIFPASMLCIRIVHACPLFSQFVAYSELSVNQPSMLL